MSNLLMIMNREVGKEREREGEREREREGGREREKYGVRFHIIVKTSNRST